MQTWLERARAIAPQRDIKRSSSDLPTIDNLEQHIDTFQSLLPEDATMRYRNLRESMENNGFHVSEQTMRNWLDRCHAKRNRALLEASIEGLPSLDRKGLQHYEQNGCKNGTQDQL